MKLLDVTLLFAVIAAVALPAGAAELPAIGEWDGVTPSAALEGPYEDPANYNVPFGIISYYNHPWRGYMDTWPASRYLECPSAQWNVPHKYAKALAPLLEEWGIRSLRIEIGWGSMGWDGDLMPHVKQRLTELLRLLKQHNIRPLMLLNAHHGVPCPMREVRVEVVQDAKKGDTTLKLKSTQGIRPGYTGLPHPKDYWAAALLITRIDDDGTVHLSRKLIEDVKAGPLRLQELKYQPFQGTKLEDGTPVPAAMETFRGWLEYAAAVGRCCRQALGTEGQPDAGFDIEVWNEQTFGSNFLHIERYYDDPPRYAEYYQHRKTRPRLPHYAPDARLEFVQRGSTCYNILPMTIDYFNDPANGFPGVRVISGFANQWPWDSGTGLWDGQAGFSRHYYTGGWRDCSPETPLGKVNSGTIDALGRFDGTKDGKDWHTIIPGTNFVPTFRCGFPEFLHSGFKTESLSRDVIPDSRLVRFRGHGRYTHNGDYRTAELWETEVNYHRWPFFAKLMKETGTQRDDPRILALDQHMAGKMLLRQYLFHAHKGLRRIYIFCLNADPCSFGMLPREFYAALDKTNGELTDEVRATIPPEFTGLAWLKNLMAKGIEMPEPRALRVDKLVEYKPRLVFAGDGTPAHPHVWNRDWFAFLPFQLTANEYVIPYYVVTLDVTHEWDKTKDPLDPARYDMPDQEFDVTIGNVRGIGARVSCYDPLTNRDVPVKTVAATPTSLTVRLRTVDYPRVLRVIEDQAGPLILDPVVRGADDGTLTVSWKTNMPVTASITYGRGWENRSARRIDLLPGLTEYAVTIPTDITGVAAVRITVSAHGLTNAWPRWDEDPRGQVVIPGWPAEPEKRQPFALQMSTETEPAELAVPDGFELPVLEMNEERGYSVRLPRGVMLSGPADDREGSLVSDAGVIALRVRCVRNPVSVDDYLPFAAVGDEHTRKPVLLPDGTKAQLELFSLMPAAHPGMTNLRQQHLLVALPGDRNTTDLLIVSASGTPEAMAASQETIDGILASIQIGR